MRRQSICWIVAACFYLKIHSTDRSITHVRCMYFSHFKVEKSLPTELSTYSACSTFVLNQSRVKWRQMLSLIPFRIHFPYASLCRHSTTVMTCSHLHIQRVCMIPHVSETRFGKVMFCAIGLQTAKCSTDLQHQRLSICKWLSLA